MLCECARARVCCHRQGEMSPGGRGLTVMGSGSGQGARGGSTNNGVSRILTQSGVASKH